MKIKALIIIIVLLIAIILGITIYPMLVGKGSSSDNDKTEKVEYTDLHLGDPFITNVTDSKSLIKVGVTIRLNDKEAAQQLEKNSGEVRDIINFILRSKTEEEFRRQSIQQVLKEEIRNNVNERFDFDCVEDVFFTEIVLQ